jgi:NADH:ubiquinone oxidoreductase subunit 3 (subunit A)
MEGISLLSPPIAFVVMLLAVMGLAAALKPLAFKRASQPAGAAKPYACGEDVPDVGARPEYGAFFPFAFFFTLLDVLTLILTTALVDSRAALGIGVLYILGAVVGLTVLYRR